jgi:hypothetical protein
MWLNLMNRNTTKKTNKKRKLRLVAWSTKHLEDLLGLYGLATQADVAVT